MQTPTRAETYSFEVATKEAGTWRRRVYPVGSLSDGMALLDFVGSTTTSRADVNLYRVVTTYGPGIDTRREFLAGRTYHNGNEVI